MGVSIGINYEKFFAHLAGKITASDKKLLLKAMRLVVVHSNPSAFYYAAVDVRDSWKVKINARIEEAMEKEDEEEAKENASE